MNSFRQGKSDRATDNASATPSVPPTSSAVKRAGDFAEMRLPQPASDIDVVQIFVNLAPELVLRSVELDNFASENRERLIPVDNEPMVLVAIDKALRDSRRGLSLRKLFAPEKSLGVLGRRLRNTLKIT